MCALDGAQAGACDSANTTAACKAKPYCVWEVNQYDGKPGCLHVDTASRGVDAFSKEYAAIKVRAGPPAQVQQCRHAMRGCVCVSEVHVACLPGCTQDSCLKMATEEDCVQPRFNATNVGQFRTQPDMLKQQQTDKVACVL